MNRTHSILTVICLLALAACAAPVVDSQREVIVDGNKLKFTTGTIPGGRFVTVDNVAKHWVGSMKGGKEKWVARAELLNEQSINEIRRICGEWFYARQNGPTFNMMDKDDTMGGMAPILGIAASMAAHAAAYSATDAANVPISVNTEFSCSRDEK